MENTSNELDDSWGAGLPCDLVRCIGDRLDDLARIWFRAVCRSWRAALPAGRLTSIPSPLVVIPAIPNRSLALPLLRSVVDSYGSTGSSSTALSLHVVVDSELRCVGSSGGWLAVADSHSVIRLVNALTLREAACLPPLPRSAEITDDSSSTREWGHMIRDCEHTIHKMAFSVKPGGSSYAHSAAALHCATGPGFGLALTFTRAGWDRWVWRQPTTHRSLFIGAEDDHFDIAYCQRSGVYYVLTPLASVWVLDMNAPVPTLEPFVWPHESLRPATFAERRHLVVLSDNGGNGALSQIYMVIIKEEQQQQRVTVHKYMTGKSWNVVSDLGGRALLIARRAQSMSVLPKASPPWLRPDCIYWMTDEWYHQRICPVWRFHVPTNTTDRFQENQVGADYRLDWHNSLWLAPSLT